MPRRFIRLKKKRPTAQDAREFLRKGRAGVGPRDFVTPEERLQRLDELNREIRELIRQHLPRGRRLDLIVLKGHLLVEFMLNQYIMLMSQSEVDMERERFSFPQKMTIVHALGFPYDPLFFPCLEILNSLRNQVGHTLRLDSTIVDRLLALTDDGSDEGREINDAYRATALRGIIRSLCLQVLGVIEGLHAGEIYSDA